jgi:multiple sugar transport system ATP-binding protein
MFVAGFMGSPSMNFISAEITTSNGKTAVTFPVSADRIATLPLYNGAADRVKSKKVVLGIRPEHLSRADSDRARRDGVATMSAPVEVVEPTGAETIAVLRIGDHEVIGRFTPDEAPRMGEDMPLAVDMSRACLFDPETTRLI